MLRTKSTLILSFGLFVIVGCASPVREVLRLVPVPADENGPVVCKVTYVAPGTPAQSAGIAPGDAIQRIDGKRFTQAVEFLKALNDAPDTLQLGLDRNGREREVTVKLAAKPPRLGVRCDIAGVQAVVEDEDNRDRYVVVENRKGVALSADALEDGGLVRIAIGLENFTDHELAVDPTLFTAVDGTGVKLLRLPPADAVRHLKGNPGAMVRASQTEELKGQTVAPNAVAAGALYFAGPAAYPFRLFAEVGGEKFEFHFENRKAT